MPATKKSVLVFLVTLLVGFITGFIVGQTVNRDTTQHIETTVPEAKDHLYESSVSILISSGFEKSSYTSSDLSIPASTQEIIASIFATNEIQNSLSSKFSDIQYDLSLDFSENTSIFYLRVTGEDPEQLNEICNQAASLLCAKATPVISGTCHMLNSAHTIQLS